MRGFKPGAKPKTQHYASGGRVQGPGSGTSDDIQTQVPEGSYIMPADSTSQLGAPALAGMGQPVDVNLSNGEYQLPPEQVHAVGVQALDAMKAATHTPVAKGFKPGKAGKPELFFANGGAVEDERRRLARPGYDPQLQIRAAQAREDASAQRRMTAVSPGYDPQPAIGGAQAREDAAQQRNARLGFPPPSGDNPARAARLQAQADAPVTGPRNPAPALPARGMVRRDQFAAPEQGPDPLAQAGAMQAYDIAERATQAGIAGPGQGTGPSVATPAEEPAPRGMGFARNGVEGTGKAAAGVIYGPLAATADYGRIGLTRLAGGDPDTLPGGPDKYRRLSGDLLGEGVDQLNAASSQLRGEVRDVLGAQPAAPSAPAVAAAPTPSAAPIGSAQANERPAPDGSPLLPDASGNTAPPTPSAPVAAGFRQTGIAGVVGRAGADGVPEFSNQAADVQGAGAQPAGGIARVGDGQGGTLSFGEAGDSALALGRFERANQERALMNANRPRELGDNGGRLTVVADSSRAPTRQERQRALLENRQAQTEALRNEVQLGFRRADREDADSASRRGLADQQLQTGQFDLANRERLAALQEQLLSPNLSAEQRRTLAEQYRTLTGSKAENRFTVVPGGAEYDAAAGAVVNRPARVINNQTGDFVDAAQAQPTAAAQPPKVGEQRGGYRFKGGNPADQSNWEKV